MLEHRSSFVRQRLPEFPQGSCIPKVIHQTFPGRPPETIRKNIERLRRTNPGWDYRLYDDEAIVEYIGHAYGSRVLADFNRIDKAYGATRADFFRYLLLYREGGVYLDIKSTTERALDEVLHGDDVYLLSRWPTASDDPYSGWGVHPELNAVGGREFQQWHIMAAPGHPFLHAVISRVRHNIAHYSPLFQHTGRRGVLRLAGPIAYTLAIAPLLAGEHHRLVENHHALGLTYNIFGTSHYRPHRVIFSGAHYDELTAPIVAPTGAGRALWTLAGPVKHRLLEPMRRVSGAINRRLVRVGK